MFATCRWTVCSLSTSEPAISRFERPAATSRSTSASRPVSGESPFASTGDCVVEEPGERTLELALVVDVRQMGVAPERHEPSVREERGELAPTADRNGPIAPAMEHERRHRHAREERPGVAVQLELEEGRGEFGVGGVALVPAERRDLVTARVRDDQPGEHLRGERPVRPHEVDDRATRRFGKVVPRDVAPEEHDLPHELRGASGEARRHDGRAREGEHGRRLVPARVDHRPEDARVELDRWRPGQLTSRESRTEPVVADDAVAPRELRVEVARARVVPLLLQVRHPLRAEHEQRPLAERRVRDAAAVDLAEPDVLLHDP